jgi:hypothetical protein
VGPDDLLRWIQVLRDAREENLARKPIATIEDPLTYSKPWIIKRVADLDTKDEIGEYVCIDRDAAHMVGK